MIPISIIHFSLEGCKGSCDIERKIVLNINQGDKKIIAMDLSEREIISSS